MDYNNYTQQQLNDALNSASYHNKFETIKELLTSPKLKMHAQINADSRFIANICSHSDLNILRYVLTSPELKEHADIHADSERALCCAVYEGDINMVKYLLTSPELKDHSNIYNANDNGDYLAIEYIFKVRSFATSEKLIDYFTLDYAVEKKDSKIFKELIESADDEDLRVQIINNLFSVILKEQNEIHQHELKVLLRDLDEEKFKMLKAYTLSKELDKELPQDQTQSSSKLKI